MVCWVDGRGIHMNSACREMVGRFGFPVRASGIWKQRQILLMQMQGPSCFCYYSTHFLLNGLWAFTFSFLPFCYRGAGITDSCHSVWGLHGDWTQIFRHACTISVFTQWITSTVWSGSLFCLMNMLFGVEGVTLCTEVVGEYRDSISLYNNLCLTRFQMSLTLMSEGVLSSLSSIARVQTCHSVWSALGWGCHYWVHKRLSFHMPAEWWADCCLAWWRRYARE